MPNTTSTRESKTATMPANTAQPTAAMLPRLVLKPTSRNTTALATNPKYSQRSSSSRVVRSDMPT